MTQRRMQTAAALLLVLLVLLGGAARAADGTVPCPDGQQAADAAHCSPAPPPARNLVTCKDGTLSKGGHGACRQHGGLRRKTDKAAPAPAPGAGVPNP